MEAVTKKMRFVIAIFLIASWIAFGVYYMRFRPAPPEPDRQASAASAAQPPKPAAPAATSPKPDPGVAMEPMRRDVRNVTPDHVLPGPIIQDRMIARLPAMQPEPPSARPPQQRAWPRVTVLSVGSVRSENTEIAFAGIDPLATGAECRAGDGSTWPCGNFARAALQRLIRRRTIECNPVGSGNEHAGGEMKGKQTTADTIATRCQVSGRDIGEWLVMQGWARPLPGSGYDKAFEEAQKAGRGQWRRDNPDDARGL